MQKGKEELLKILRETRALLELPENDFGWSSWNNARDALAELDPLMANVASGRHFDFTKLSTLYAPTGCIQEVSISSGWGQKFVEIAEKFDSALMNYCRDVQA